VPACFHSVALALCVAAGVAAVALEQIAVFPAVAFVVARFAAALALQAAATAAVVVRAVFE
jgi:hypothetical protein